MLEVKDLSDDMLPRRRLVALRLCSGGAARRANEQNCAQARSCSPAAGVAGCRFLTHLCRHRRKRGNAAAACDWRALSKSAGHSRP
jgi:hypothetical protein